MRLLSGPEVAVNETVSFCACVGPIVEGLACVELEVMQSLQSDLLQDLCRLLIL